MPCRTQIVPLAAIIVALGSGAEAIGTVEKIGGALATALAESTLVGSRHGGELLEH